MFLTCYGENSTRWIAYPPKNDSIILKISKIERFAQKASFSVSPYGFYNIGVSTTSGILDFVLVYMSTIAISLKKHYGISS